MQDNGLNMTKKPAKRKYTKRTDEERIAELEAELAQARERARLERLFSPEKMLADRERLELSAADYAELIGCSALSVYGWEHGRTTPRPKQIESWLRVTELGKRAAWKQLGLV